MPRPKGIPAYRLHKASGPARVIIGGRHVAPGPHRSPESHVEYARVVAEYVRRSPLWTAVQRGGSVGLQNVAQVRRGRFASGQ